MGLLDDAIREHLELKRRLGADSNEIERLEGEAFGPASRPGDPDFPEPATGEEPIDEPATTLLDDPSAEPRDPAEAPFDASGDWDGPSGAEPADDPARDAEPADGEVTERDPEDPEVESASDPGAEPAEDPLVEPAAGIFDIESTAVDLDDEEDFVEASADPDPLAGDAIVEEPPVEPEPTTISRLPEEDLVASLGDAPEAAPDPEDLEPELELQPEEPEPVRPEEPEEPFAGIEPPDEPDQPFEPPVAEEPPPTTISPTIPPAEPVAESPVEAPVDELDIEEEEEVLDGEEVIDPPAEAPLGSEPPADDFADIELDADEELEPPPAVDDPFATVEHPSARPDAPSDPGPPQETTESPTPDDEDVLEETPDFLRDQPEDDELWFEQGKPKDFDF